jgi:hypothetical protein
MICYWNGKDMVNIRKVGVYSKNPSVSGSTVTGIAQNYREKKPEKVSLW